MFKAKILIVDDAEIVLLGWQYALKSEGYYVRTATNGQDAINIVEQDKPDIVITDLVMPDMDGVEVCKKVKSMSPETEVILISGHPEELERQQTDFIRAGGRKEIFRKPILKDDMMKTLERIMSAA